MKTVIEMARAVYGANTEWSSSQLERLEQFAELVRADETEKYKWDIHSCGPTCEKKGCVAVREAVLAEREACAEFLESTNLGGLPEVTALQYARLIKGFAKGIRTRGTHEA